MSTDVLPAWRRVERAILGGRWTYGDLIQDGELLELLELPKPGPDDTAAAAEHWRLRVLSEVSPLREQMLTEHRMLLVREAGTGYRIVMPSDQTAVVNARQRARVAKELKAWREGLAYVDFGRLTVAERQANTDAQISLAKKVDLLRAQDRFPKIEKGD